MRTKWMLPYATPAVDIARDALEYGTPADWAAALPAITTAITGYETELEFFLSEHHYLCSVRDCLTEADVPVIRPIGYYYKL